MSYIIGARKSILLGFEPAVYTSAMACTVTVCALPSKRSKVTGYTYGEKSQVTPMVGLTCCGEDPDSTCPGGGDKIL